MAKRTPSIESLRFEEAMSQLEELVERIESGEVGLEDALKQYERGIALIRHCRRILDLAQQRIAELTPSPNGGLGVDGQTESASAQDQDQQEDSADAALLADEDVEEDD